MKRIFFFTITFVLLVIVDAAAQVKLPATSPMQTIRQEFGLGNIEITYSRPSAKKRRVFGDLVPYGKLWRTGANASTKISFSDPVEIIGRKIDSGTYVLYTIPGEESWEIIINKGIKNVGTEGYKEAEDVARFKVDPIKLKSKTELFTIQFSNIKPDSCEVHLTWEKKLIVIPVTVNIKEKIRTQIDAAMGTKNKPYWQAAQFYYEYDRNLNKALENVNKAVESNPRAYWMFFYRAQIQKDMGDKAGALQSSSRSLELAKKAKNEDYIKMNQQLQKGLKK